MSSEHFPILSGDFDSLELTESQQKLNDILKALGKMSLILSESSARFRTEKVGGLESFLYQVKKITDENPSKLDREALEQLELDVRYTEDEQKIGNKTEFLRVLLANVHSNKDFKELIDEVIKEQLDLSKKRAINRQLAEQSQSEKIGN